MPILEYQCKECEHQFETIVLGAQQPACPSCHSTKLERLLSVFAVVGKSDSVAASESFGPAAPVVTLWSGCLHTVLALGMDPQLLAGQPGGTQTVRSSLYPTHFRVFSYSSPLQQNPLKMSTYQLFMTFSRLDMGPRRL